jgi:hypothetical protein
MRDLYKEYIDEYLKWLIARVVAEVRRERAQWK